MPLKDYYAQELVPIIIIPLVVLSLAIGMLTFMNAVELVGKRTPGVFFYKNLVVSIYQRGEWLGARLQPKPYDWIVALDGTPVGNAAEFWKVFKADQNKDSIVLTVNRNGEILNFNVATRFFTLSDFLVGFLLPFILGLIFVVMGSLLYYARPTKATMINFIMTLLIALSYMTMFDVSTTHVFSALWLIYPLFGAISVHLFLLFPEESNFVRRHHWVCYLPYVPAILIIVFRYLNEYNQPLSILFSRLALVFMVSVFVLDLTLLIAAYRRETEGVMKQRAKIVAFALVVAAFMPVVWSTLYALWRPVLSIEFAIGLAIVFPILVGYAATKTKFFDIDMVIKAGISYGLLSGAAVVLYLIVVTTVSLFTQNLLMLEDSPLAQIVSTLVLVVVFDPLRRGIQHGIDRSFYRDKYNFQRGLLDLGHRLGTEVFDVDEIGDIVVSKYKELPRVEAAYLFLRDGGERYALHCGCPWDGGTVSLRSRYLREGVLRRGFTLDLEELRLNRDIDLQDRGKLEEINVKSLVPMVTKSGLIGMIGLGERLSKLPFSNDERSLLESIAHQTAITIENRWFYEQKSVDERLTTLGKASSMIIHEIKNPLGVIRVSSGTLKKKFEKEKEEEGFELASFIEEEVLRMDSTVRKFLTYVKTQEPERETVYINEVVRKALRTLDVELESLRVELQLDEHAEGIQADADHLYQIMLNLILNAREATPAGGRIIIRTRDFGDALCLTVADTGRGLEKRLQGIIFKPFQSGRKGGIGLGLTIAKQLVESHGGTIRLRSKVGKGTVFRIFLPKDIRESKAKWIN